MENIDYTSCFSDPFDEFFNLGSEQTFTCTSGYFGSEGSFENEQCDSFPLFSMNSGTPSPVSTVQHLNIKENAPKVANKPIPGIQKPKKKSTRAAAGSLGEKNLIKNYANAIASFAITFTARPYIEPLAKERGIRLSEFDKFVLQKKKSLTSLESFKEILTISKADSGKERIFKEIFRRAAVVFVKYFSVNWIFSGKLQYKDIHLKYRFKMLRGIQNPELFSNFREKRLK